MRKIFIACMIAVLSMLVIAQPADAATGISVTVDGKPIVFEGQDPIIVSGRTLVPVRGVFEH